RPALATTWTTPNSKQIIFNLRKGVKFHNGQELTADDVVYSVQQILNPPLPGSTSTLGQVPAIAGATKLGKYQVRIDLKAPDARVFGFFAWGRYSAITPNGMYQQLDPSTNGIGTGPFKLNGPYVPNSHVNLTKNANFWKPGLPYLDAVNMPIITDEQSRVAALKANQ